MLNSTSLHVDVCLHVLWVGVWVKILNALQITGPQNDRGPENVSLAVQRCWRLHGERISRCTATCIFVMVGDGHFQKLLIQMWSSLFLCASLCVSPLFLSGCWPAFLLSIPPLFLPSLHSSLSPAHSFLSTIALLPPPSLLSLTPSLSPLFLSPPPIPSHLRKEAVWTVYVFALFKG